MSDSPSKGIAAMLVDKMGKKSPAESEGGDEAHMCCEDILAAIEAKDPAALKSALSAFLAYQDDDSAPAEDDLA